MDSRLRSRTRIHGGPGTPWGTPDCTGDQLDEEPLPLKFSPTSEKSPQSIV